jgi:hypothetical protein
MGIQRRISCGCRVGSVGCREGLFVVQRIISWRCREGSVGCREGSFGVQRRIIWGCREGSVGGTGKDSLAVQGRMSWGAGKDELW